ncbi:MAG: NusA-like transcription termination signal-binding factor [Candidatus Aenigmatarchaeota archaeon]
MKRELNTSTIRFLNLFENITNVRVVDCFENDNTVYYIVEEGKAGLAIGKGGSLIKYVEKLLGKHVKVFEYSSDINDFIKNIIAADVEATIIEEDGKNIAEIKINKRDKNKVFGRNKQKFKILKEILKRLHDIDDVRLK